MEGILGIRPDLGGLLLAPAIPASWDHLEIEKDFRGRKLHIVIENPDGKQSGCSSLSVNRTQLADNYVPEALLTKDTEIRLIM